MEALPIDLETESIQFDGVWYTRDRLAQHIRALLDAGDFAISRASQALEQLNAALASLTALTVRVDTDLAGRLEALAQSRGMTVGELIRQALARLVSKGPGAGASAA